MARRTEQDLENSPHALYRFYAEQEFSDVDPELLYIGITGALPGRLLDHESKKPWWRLVARIEVEHFDTRSEALVAERDAIRYECPKYNIKHSSDRLMALRVATDRNAKRMGGCRCYARYPDEISCGTDRCPCWSRVGFDPRKIPKECRWGMRLRTVEIVERFNAAAVEAGIPVRLPVGRSW